MILSNLVDLVEDYSDSEKMENSQIRSLLDFIINSKVLIVDPDFHTTVSNDSFDVVMDPVQGVMPTMLSGPAQFYLPFYPSLTFYKNETNSVGVNHVAQTYVLKEFWWTELKKHCKQAEELEMLFGKQDFFLSSPGNID